MKRILLSGCNGHMGRVITECVAQRKDLSIVAGVDLNTVITGNYPIFPNIQDCKTIKSDVIIDYSHPSALENNLNYAVENNIPIVIATTGLSSGQLDFIKEMSTKIPIFHTANLSIGINLIAELAKKAAMVLSNDFDIEIIEKHHNKKIDAPSGTALMLANEINASLNNKLNYVHDRHSYRRPRDKNELGIHAVRGGTIVGEHEVIFAGPDEIISISHSAMSKEVFATGSINAALFLIATYEHSQSGLFSMKDLLES